jgi:hypothetical protein
MQNFGYITKQLKIENFEQFRTVSQKTIRWCGGRKMRMKRKFCCYMQRNHDFITEILNFCHSFQNKKNCRFVLSVNYVYMNFAMKLIFQPQI